MVHIGLQAKRQQAKFAILKQRKARREAHAPFDASGKLLSSAVSSKVKGQKREDPQQKQVIGMQRYG